MTTKTITKSLRLSMLESDELSQISEQTSLSESALMKKWFREGLQTQKLKLAIEAYQERQTDIRGGAELAGLSFNRFLHELEKRNIIVIDTDDYLTHVEKMADSFDLPLLRNAVEAVKQNAKA